MKPGMGKVPASAQHHGGGLPPVEHGLAHADLLDRQNVHEPGVDAFIPAAHQRQRLFPRQFAGQRLRERLTGGGEHDDPPRSAPLRFQFPQGLCTSSFPIMTMRWPGRKDGHPQYGGGLPSCRGVQDIEFRQAASHAPCRAALVSSGDSNHSGKQSQYVVLYSCPWRYRLKRRWGRRNISSVSFPKPILSSQTFVPIESLFLWFIWGKRRILQRFLKQGTHKQLQKKQLVALELHSCPPHQSGFCLVKMQRRSFQKAPSPDSFFYFNKPSATSTT